MVDQKNAAETGLYSKQGIKDAKSDFDLHWRLLMKKHGLPKADAMAVAYRQGQNDLKNQLG